MMAALVAAFITGSRKSPPRLRGILTIRSGGISEPFSSPALVAKHRQSLGWSNQTTILASAGSWSGGVDGMETLLCELLLSEALGIRRVAHERRRLIVERELDREPVLRPELPSQPPLDLLRDPVAAEHLAEPDHGPPLGPLDLLGGPL